MNIQVTALIDRYQSAWHALDADALAAMWVDDNIYYVAEEIAQPFYTLDDVIAYWRAAAEQLSSVSMQLTNMRQHPLSETLVAVTYSMHVDARMQAANATPIGIDVRVSLIVRKLTEGWRLIHYIESPLGALPYVRARYAENFNATC